MSDKYSKDYFLYNNCDTDKEWETSYLFREEIPILDGTIEEKQALMYLKPHGKSIPYFITYKIKKDSLFFTYYFNQIDNFILKCDSKNITINTPLHYNLDNQLDILSI